MDQDDCNPNPCQNGGICQDGINSHTCNCISGYDGDFCEIGNVKFCLLATLNICSICFMQIFIEKLNI